MSILFPVLFMFLIFQRQEFNTFLDMVQISQPLSPFICSWRKIHKTSAFKNVINRGIARILASFSFWPSSLFLSFIILPTP